MFGVILRAAPQALLFALLAGVLARIVGPLLDFTLQSPNANQSDLLIAGLQAASDNFLLVGLISLAVVIIARAVLESQIGGY